MCAVQSSLVGLGLVAGSRQPRPMLSCTNTRGQVRARCHVCGAWQARRLHAALRAAFLKRPRGLATTQAHTSQWPDLLTVPSGTTQIAPHNVACRSF